MIRIKKRSSALGNMEGNEDRIRGTNLALESQVPSNVKDQKCDQHRPPPQI